MEHVSVFKVLMSFCCIIPNGMLLLVKFISTNWKILILKRKLFKSKFEWSFCSSKVGPRLHKNSNQVWKLYFWKLKIEQWSLALTDGLSWAGGSPSLVVRGGDSHSEGCWFKYQYHILDRHFPHWFWAILKNINLK